VDNFVIYSSTGVFVFVFVFVLFVCFV